MTTLTTIKIYIETRKKLRLLAAMLDTSMVELMDRLVTEALEKIRNERTSTSIGRAGNQLHH